MPCTLTYVIPSFEGQAGRLAEAVPQSLGIDSSRWLPGEATVTADGPSGISLSGAGRMALRIRVRDAARRVYLPVGIATRPAVDEDDEPAPAPTVLPAETIPPREAGALELSDAQRSTPGSCGFVVLFQAPGGPIGWLDPRIVNEAM